MRTKSDIAARRGHNQQCLRGGINYFKYALAALGMAGIGASVPMGETRNLTRNLTEDDVTRAIFATLPNSTETVEYIDTAPPPTPSPSRRPPKLKKETKPTRGKTKAQHAAEQQANKIIKNGNLINLNIQTRILERGGISGWVDWLDGANKRDIAKENNWVKGTMKTFKTFYATNLGMMQDLAYNKTNTSALTDRNNQVFKVKVLKSLQKRIVDRISTIDMANYLAKDPGFSALFNKITQDSTMPIIERLPILFELVNEYFSNDEGRSVSNPISAANVTKELLRIAEVSTTRNIRGGTRILPSLSDFSIQIFQDINQMERPDDRALSSVEDYAAWMFVKFLMKRQELFNTPTTIAVEQTDAAIYKTIHNGFMKNEDIPVKTKRLIAFMDHELYKKLAPDSKEYNIDFVPESNKPFQIPKKTLEIFSENLKEFAGVMAPVRKLVTGTAYDETTLWQYESNKASADAEDYEQKLDESERKLHEAEQDRQFYKGGNDNNDKWFGIINNLTSAVTMAAVAVTTLGIVFMYGKMCRRNNNNTREIDIQNPVAGPGDIFWMNRFKSKLEQQLSNIWQQTGDDDVSPLEVYRKGWDSVAGRYKKQSPDTYYDPRGGGQHQWMKRPKERKEGLKRDAHIDQLDIALNQLHNAYYHFNEQDPPKFVFDDYYMYNGPDGYWDGEEL
jgi:hypothetical protein